MILNDDTNIFVNSEWLIDISIIQLSNNSFSSALLIFQNSKNIWEILGEIFIS